MIINKQENIGIICGYEDAAKLILKNVTIVDFDNKTVTGSCFYQSFSANITMTDVQCTNTSIKTTQ